MTNLEKAEQFIKGWIGDWSSRERDERKIIKRIGEMNLYNYWRGTLTIF